MMSNMLRQFGQSGEVLHMECKPSEHLGCTGAKLDQELDELLAAKTASEKGLFLERLVSHLVETVPGLSVLHRVRTETEK
jgi:hypothetical protein